MMLSDGAAYFLVVEICAWSVSACADSVAICDVERAKNRLVLICMGLAHVEDRLEDFARDLDHAARGLIGLLVAHEIDRFGIEIDPRHLIACADRAVLDRGLRRPPRPGRPERGAVFRSDTRRRAVGRDSGWQAVDGC